MVRTLYTMRICLYHNTARLNIVVKEGFITCLLIIIDMFVNQFVLSLFFHTSTESAILEELIKQSLLQLQGQCTGNKSR
jgi:hypothetical protein